MATKTTGAKAATAASKVLSSKSTGAASKTAAASALTQTSSPKEYSFLLQRFHPIRRSDNLHLIAINFI